QPVSPLPGLVPPNQVAYHPRLRRIGVRARLLEVSDRFLQEGGVGARRDAAVGRAGAVHVLTHRPVAPFGDTRVETVSLGDGLEIVQCDAAVERVQIGRAHV